MPLTAVQILYINLATDGLPALALAVDPPEPDIMLRKPRNPRSGIFTRPVVTLMIAGGLWSATVNLCLFAFSLLYKPFANKWLNLAVAWELLPLAAVLYVPFMQEAFSTVGLRSSEWVAILIAAGTTPPVMELMKWMLRRGWFGAID